MRTKLVYILLCSWKSVIKHSNSLRKCVATVQSTAATNYGKGAQKHAQRRALVVVAGFEPANTGFKDRCLKPLGDTTTYHTCRACSFNQARNLWVYDSSHDYANGVSLPMYGTPIVLVPFNTWPSTCVYVRSKPLQLPHGRVRRSRGISQPKLFRLHS